ncbi:gliding motility-associated C-terminal domain-containing protein [Lishizhenia tianjinensis]|uniref:Gliding motility-associated C-terminal domain-containing protein n=1 Tax=Lishizhenia tianjinensis TaxID=477690 RepID=A0A1I6ZT98_9FLAO|nr:PKD domain-containing protein [Lishizhenia tianjinensis]SFT65847.1 gliding motility-associated C-terminal domain-containing protein [Lishizhenia tianjinensis]
MKTILILSWLLISSLSFASHIVGGEIYYDNLGGNQYRVTIKLYRDCFSTGAQFDNPLPLTIFDGNGTMVLNVDVPFPGSQVLPLQFSNPCINPPTNVCVEEAIYQKVITLPTNINGFTLSYQRCCRGPNVVNLLVPDDTGLTLTTEIPAPPLGALVNSSPRFNNFPPLVVCNNDELIFDHAATDPDGDSLVYELCTPFHGGTSAMPVVNPASAPPYTPVNWSGGFSATQPFGGNSPINLDPVTGLLTASPQNLGLYAVGVCVYEYRNGVQIGVTRRDFLFKVINCDISLESIITEQVNTPGFVSFCDGLTFTFDNQSYGGSNYEWDFGVAGTTSDQSTNFEPTFTFPAEGMYQVTLIVNPGWACSDTTVETFYFYEEITNTFDQPDSMCITGNLYDFEGEGQYSGMGTQYLWTFDGHANVDSVQTEDVTGVVFDTSGFIPITFHIEENGCTSSYIDSVFIFMEPTINFYIDPALHCAPAQVLFQDSSDADAPITYLWTFGDGQSSTHQNPIHVYDNPGLYDVSLNIKVTEGCMVDTTLTKPAFIDVKPSPNSAFFVTPTVTDIFHNTFTFEDLSHEGVEHYYYFNDSVFTSDRFTTHIYQEGGYHRPYQLLINEWGCRDSSYISVYIYPLTTIYAPNAFTPNGSGVNDVFKIVIYDISEFSLEIYNRWGELIHESFDKNVGWDGKNLQGEMVKDGTYIWKIKFTNSEGVREEQLGHVNVLK